TGSNRRHADFQSAALPTELPGRTERAECSSRRFMDKTGIGPLGGRRPIATKNPLAALPLRTYIRGRFPNVWRRLPACVRGLRPTPFLTGHVPTMRHSLSRLIGVALAASTALSL